MINKLIKWAANKRGFIVEERKRLVLINKAADTTCIKMATVEHGEQATRMTSLEGMCILPGDTLKVYITN